MERVMCLSCLNPLMAAKADKKGRLYLSCEGCSSRLFLKGGVVCILRAMNTLKLLSVETNLSFVARESLKTALDPASLARAFGLPDSVSSEEAPTQNPAETAAVALWPT